LKTRSGFPERVFFFPTLKFLLKPHWSIPIKLPIQSPPPRP